MVDSTAGRNHKSAMGAKDRNQCIGGTAGGPTTKMRMIVDKRIDQERSPVENYFERIKGARGISTGYAKTVSMFAAFVTLACSYAWLKLLVD